MVLSCGGSQQRSKMQFVLRNHDGKLMLGSHEHVSLLLNVFHELYLRNEKLCADVLIVTPDREKPIPCFSNLLSPSSEYLSSLISKLRTTKTLAGPVVLFFNEVPGAEIEKMIHFINFGYVYLTPENLHDFVQMCQRFELHCFKEINTFVFDFYEPSTFHEFQQLPTKERYSWIEKCKIKFDSKTNTNQDLEAIAKLIMNKEISLTKNIFLAENNLAIEGAPPTPEPEETFEQKSNYEGMLNFDFRADEDVVTDPKLRFLQGFNLVRTGTVIQKIETPRNTPSSSENEKPSKKEKKTKKKAVEGVKRPQSATSKDVVQANKRRRTSKDDDYKPDRNQNSSKKKDSTVGRSSYKQYTQDNLDYAILEVLMGTLVPHQTLEKHEVPSRTIYDRLNKLKHYTGKEDCGLSPYIVVIHLVLKRTKNGKYKKNEKKRKNEKKHVMLSEKALKKKRLQVKSKDGFAKQIICV